MRVYADIYDVPGHWIGWIEGEVEDDGAPAVGDVVRLPVPPETRSQTLRIEAILPGANGSQHRLTDIVFERTAEAASYIQALEGTGAFLFWQAR